METSLFSLLDRDPGLVVRTQRGDHPPKPSTGSSKAERLVSLTALGYTPGLRTRFLVSGKWSILLIRMEWEEVAQFRAQT